MRVRNGFDSATFTAGEFRFYISEVQNPFTTDESGKFGMKVYDKNSELQYYFNGTTKAKVSASPFSFAFVESTSPENGVSSIYKFSLTIAVDTPAASVLMIGLPADLEFDDTMPFTCKGTMNIAGNLTCYERNKKVIHIRIMSDQARTNYIINGTTISF